MPEIIFEDSEIIAIDKPAGMITIPDIHTPKEKTLLGKLEKQINQKLYVVHRLDKDTSGIMIFAKTAEAHRLLNLEFEKQQVEKIYWGIVAGRVDFAEKEVDLPVKKEPKISSRARLAQRGPRAATRLKVLEKFKNYTLLEIRPLSGKRHQIRLHLKSLGYPLAIDPVYGNPKPLYLSSFKINYKMKAEQPEKPIIERLPLHALSLALNKLRFEAPLPKDFSYFLKTLRKFN